MFLHEELMQDFFKFLTERICKSKYTRLGSMEATMDERQAIKGMDNG